MQMDQLAADKLRDLVASSMDSLRGPLGSNEKLIADIYTGRDPLGGLNGLVLPEQGVPAHIFNEPLGVGSWRPPETTANLFLSRLRQIVTGLTPGVPSFRAKARVAGAAHLVEKQNQLMRMMTDHGHLREAMRKAAFIGMLSPYFGVKAAFDKSEKYAYNRIKYLALEPRDCGYEPFYRRFVWHAYDIQWGDIPEKWRPERDEEDPPAWTICRVTEVYHDGFRHGNIGVGKEKCPMSIFVSVPTDKEPAASSSIPLSADSRLHARDELGVYVTTESVAACPVIIGNFLDPAPNEDVPASEVLSWIPLMRMIVQTLVQIDREIRTLNKTVLFDKNAISEEAIGAVKHIAPGGTVFVGVDPDDTGRGVNATMRPVEQSAVLQEYLAALSTYMQLFDDVTGVSPTMRGMAANPRKSATEAAAITENANQRNADRLEVMAGMWTRLAQATFKYQRQIFGTEVEIPLSNGVIRNLFVPDPATACFTFDIDPVELGHLSNAGDIQALMQWLTVTTNTQRAFATGMPRMTREALRRLGNAMGIEDADIFLDSPTIELGPEERYIRYLQTQQPIAVYEDDQHDLYIGYYNKMLQSLAVTNATPDSTLELRNAISMHQMFAARRMDVLNPAQGGEIIPGVGAGPGEIDNNLQSALATNAIPSAVPQPTTPNY